MTPQEIKNRVIEIRKELSTLMVELPKFETRPYPQPQQDEFYIFEGVYRSAGILNGTIAHIDNLINAK